MKEGKKNRFSKYYTIFMIAELILFLGVTVYFALYMDTNCAPDEYMRLMLPKYIAKTGKLPTGMEEETINSMWGISYALYPYLPSILGGYLARFALFVGTGKGTVRFCARLISVLSGAGSLFLFHKIGQELFEDERKTLVFATLAGFLPQFVFLSMYHNNDSLSVFTMALQVYFWIRAAKQGWTTKNCIGIAVGCGLCALTYYFGCAYIIGSIFFFFFSNAAQKAGWKKTLKSLAVIVVLTALIAGWFFLRNAYLHDGDFLGFRTSRLSALAYAQEGFKPGQRPSMAEQGISPKTVFLQEVLGQQWFVNSWRSFIGVFSYMSIPMHNLFYMCYSALFFVGAGLFVIIGFWKQWAKTKIWRVFVYALLLTGFVTVVFSMYNTYFSDYQAQGRYVIGGMIPLMLFVSVGYGQVIDLIFHREDGGSRQLRRFGLMELICYLYLIAFIMVVVLYMSKMIPH